MTSFSILPLGGFISVSLSISYLREQNKAQRKKQEAISLSRDYLHEADTWRNVPESSPHGSPLLFKSLDAAALMLRMGSETVRRNVTPTEHALLYETVSRLQQRTQLCRSRLQRTVVIEGPQGCGASTLIRNLARSTPAKCSAPHTWDGIIALRKKLRTLPTPLLAAFESVCDYCFVIDAEESEDEATVFVERLHHSRISHSLCSEEIPMDHASFPASAFAWPRDLPQPTLVVYMVLPHQDTGARGGTIPLTEYSKIQLIHSKVTGPQFAAIDASGSEEDVLETVLQCCQSHGVSLRRQAVAEEETSNHCPDVSTDQDHDAEGAIVINLSDAPLSRQHSDCSESSVSRGRQSMGWYGAFMSGGGE